MGFSLFDLEDEKVENKKVRVVGNSIQVLDEEIRSQIDKKKLSASLVSSILNSPGDWVMSTYIEPLCIDGYVDALERGTWFHSIMEEFFKLEPEERNFKNLASTALTVTKEKYPHMMERQDNKDWLNKAIQGYKNTWLDGAKDEKVANLYLMGKSQLGLELFVNGTIGNAKRQCLGFIDKIIEGKYGLIVQDWKTGAKIHNFNPDKEPSESNSFDYWRQQTFYTMLLEQLGMKVESACLVFPCSEPPQIVNVDCHREDVRNRVVSDFEKADSILEECIMNDYTFPFKAGKYNSWATYLCGLGRAYPPKIITDRLNQYVEMR